MACVMVGGLLLQACRLGAARPLRRFSSSGQETCLALKISFVQEAGGKLIAPCLWGLAFDRVGRQDADALCSFLVGRDEEKLTFLIRLWLDGQAGSLRFLPASEVLFAGLLTSPLHSADAERCVDSPVFTWSTSGPRSGLPWSPGRRVCGARHHGPRTGAAE